MYSFFLFFNPYYRLHYNYEILTKKDNVFVMLQVHVYNSLQKVFKLLKKLLHTSIISESMKFLIKRY